MNQTDNIEAIAQIERRRRFLGMKQADLCKSAGCSVPTYNAWRKNGTSVFNVKRLSNALMHFASQNKIDP